MKTAPNDPHISPNPAGVPRTRSSSSYPGQASVIVAVSVVALLGAVALGVDVGNSYVQQRHVQNIAVSASKAGTIALTRGVQRDDVVKLVIRHDLTLYGVSASSVTFDTSPSTQSPAAGNYNVLAQYIYSTPSQPTVYTSTGHYVGSGGSIPTALVGGVNVQANAVHIDYLKTAAPAWFARVFGKGSFNVSAVGFAPRKPVPTVANVPYIPQNTNTPTSAPTASSTATATSAPTASSTATATGTSTASSTATATSTPTASSTATATGTPTRTSTATTSPTATSVPACTGVQISFPSGQLASGHSYYQVLTINSTGDITATTTWTNGSANNNMYIYLYQGAVTITNPGSFDPSGGTLPTGATAIEDHASTSVTTHALTLNYTTDKGGALPVGTYTLLYYNGSSQALNPAAGTQTPSCPLPVATSTSTATSPSTATSTSTATSPSTATSTSTATAAATATATRTGTPLATGTATRTPTVTATSAPTSTGTVTPTPSVTPTGVAPSFPAGGASNFVLWGGNGSSAACPDGGLCVGQNVNFWGHSWADQVIGGNYLDNPRFKGFDGSIANSLQETVGISITQSGVVVTSTALLAACNPSNPSLASCWDVKSGNSFPPATLPCSYSTPPGCYLDMIVSNYITKSGGDNFGNVIAVVKVLVTNPSSYAADPGHQGFGTIVGDVWELNTSSPVVHCPNQGYANDKCPLIAP